jgi:hypothetical protein
MGSLLLTISKLKRWSITYFIDTANTAQRATADFQRANGGLDEYCSEHETHGSGFRVAMMYVTSSRPCE